MADIFTKTKRSEIMSHIRGKNSRQEVLVRKYLFSQGFRYRLHDNDLPGKPDIRLPKYNCVIFINGCFWHGHEKCKLAKVPATNEDYWSEKISINIKRDAVVKKKLKKLGYTVIFVWQCQLSNKMKISKTLEFLVKKIRKASINKVPKIFDR